MHVDVGAFMCVFPGAGPEQLNRMRKIVCRGIVSSAENDDSGTARLPSVRLSRGRAIIFYRLPVRRAMRQSGSSLLVQADTFAANWMLYCCERSGMLDMLKN